MAGSYTEKFIEGHVPLLVEYADSQDAGAHNTAWANMERYHRGFLFVNVGDMAQGATLDIQLQQATDALGTGAKAIAGKAITQLTQATADNDSLVGIELRTAELDVDGGFSFVRAAVTVAVAAVEYSLTYWGIITRYAPVPVAAWTEVVA